MADEVYTVQYVVDDAAAGASVARMEQQLDRVGQAAQRSGQQLDRMGQNAQRGAQQIEQTATRASSALSGGVAAGAAAAESRLGSMAGKARSAAGEVEKIGNKASNVANVASGIGGAFGFDAIVVGAGLAAGAIMLLAGDTKTLADRAKDAADALAGAVGAGVDLLGAKLGKTQADQGVVDARKNIAAATKGVSDAEQHYDQVLKGTKATREQIIAAENRAAQATLRSKSAAISAESADASLERTRKRKHVTTQEVNIAEEKAALAHQKSGLAAREASQAEAAYERTLKGGKPTHDEIAKAAAAVTAAKQKLALANRGLAPAEQAALQAGEKVAQQYKASHEQADKLAKKLDDLGDKATSNATKVIHGAHGGQVAIVDQAKAADNFASSILKATQGNDEFSQRSQATARAAAGLVKQLGLVKSPETIKLITKAISEGASPTELRDQIAGLPSSKTINIDVYTHRHGGAQMGPAVGGIVAGTYDARDDVPVNVSKGEVILNPMQQQMLGRDRVMSVLNSTGAVTISPGGSYKGGGKPHDRKATDFVPGAILDQLARAASTRSKADDRVAGARGVRAVERALHRHDLTDGERRSLLELLGRYRRLEHTGLKPISMDDRLSRQSDVFSAAFNRLDLRLAAAEGTRDIKDDVSALQQEQALIGRREVQIRHELATYHLTASQRASLEQELAGLIRQTRDIGDEIVRLSKQGVSDRFVPQDTGSGGGGGGSGSGGGTGSSSGFTDADIQAILSQNQTLRDAAVFGANVDAAVAGVIAGGGPTYQSGVPMQPIIINTLHPGDPRTLDAIGRAATQGQSQQSYRRASRVTIGGGVL